MSYPDVNKRVLLITSTNLACNPRCLKELELLSSMKMDVTVVAFELYNWTTEKEKLLRTMFPKVSFHYLDASKRNLASWIKATIFEKLSRLLVRLFPYHNYLNAMALSKRSSLLLNWVQKERIQTDLIIAHNPAAFYPAYWLAKKHNVPFALDIEDYHPGEGTDLISRRASGLLMKNLLPDTTYNSFASPLIMEYSLQLAGHRFSSRNILANNAFSAGEFVYETSAELNTEKLKIVWFSQFIDYGRGLEKILPVLDRMTDLVELTLIGNLRQTFSEKELQQRNFIRLTGPLSQKELNAGLGAYDIGLAIEDGEQDINRDICLTNKIWAYFQAGLYIFASDTSAQKNFIAEHPGSGICLSLEPGLMEAKFHELIRQKELIRSVKLNRFTTAKGYSWEHESNALVEVWNEVLA